MDNINEITRDCFNALTQIRHLDERSQPMPEVLYQRMSTFIQRAMDQAHQKFGPQDAQDITYAIVALTDEVVLSKGGALRDYWLANMLQLRFFNENVAGENFFVRLAQLLTQPNRQDVLRVYYLCLLFGFQGASRCRFATTDARCIGHPERSQPASRIFFLIFRRHLRRYEDARQTAVNPSLLGDPIHDAWQRALVMSEAHR